jgi:hypothetical protein
MDLIRWNFQGINTGFLIWLVIVAATILLFCCFKLWAVQRIGWTDNCEYVLVVRLYTFNNLLVWDVNVR